MITIGSQCTHWDDERKRWCGQAVVCLQRTRDGTKFLDVLCADHRTPGCVPITEAFELAPRSRFMVTT